MIDAFLKSLAQLTDGAVLRVLMLSMALSLAVFALCGWLLFIGLDQLIGRTFGDFQSRTGLAGILAALSTIFAGWLLWRIVAISVIQLFADSIVAAVERRHYPGRAMQARAPGLGPSLRMALASLGRAIGYNAIALPFYLVLLFTGIGAPLIFLAVNALLVGRDLAEMVLVRHAPEQGLAIDRLTRFLLGLVANLLLLVPFVNLLAPVIAASMATHLAHGKALPEKGDAPR